MAKLTFIAAAAVLWTAVLTMNPAQATPLGAATNVRPPTDVISPVTNVWWGHRHFAFRHPFFARRAFAFRHPFFARRAFALHRFHRPFFVRRTVVVVRH